MNNAFFLAATALAAATLASAAPAQAQNISLGVDRRGELVVSFGNGGQGGWRDPRLHWRDYGYDEYCPRRGWRSGSVWHRDPFSRRGSSHWSARDRFSDDWDDPWRGGNWRGDDWRGDRNWSHRAELRGSDRLRCNRVVVQDHWQGRPAHVSVRVCEDRSGRQFVDHSDRRFVGWAW